MRDAFRIFDHLFFLLFLVVPLIEWRILWPGLVSRTAAGDLKARFRYYCGVVFWEWVAVFCVAALWTGRPPGWLMLGRATPVRLGLGLGVAALLILLLVFQRRAILKRPSACEKVRTSLLKMETLLPHTTAEHRLFWLVSLTAGICEETLYRGFLLWYLSAWMGPVAGVVLSSLIFGLGHIYLGVAHVPKTAIVGLFFAGVAIASGSLWPAMLLHAAIDWNSGELSYRLLKTPVQDAQESQ